MAESINSNVVGLSYAEEVTPKNLIGDVNDVWRPLEPNSYDEFGAELTLLAREPITGGRQRKKGAITDLEASGGFNHDMILYAVDRLIQGFFMADAYERPSNDCLSGAALDTVTLVSVAATPSITVGVGDGAKFSAGMIIKLSGMANAANNRNEIVVVSIAGDVLTVDGALVVEASPPANARIEVVGFEFPDNTMSVAYTAPTLTISKSGGNFDSKIGFQVGETIFIGGDAAANQFAGVGGATNKGYAKIAAVGAASLTLTEASFTPITEASAAGKKIRIYFGRFIKNEKLINLIKIRSFQFEQTLGQDINGTQSQYLKGAFANEFTLNIEATDKLNFDMSFVSLDLETRTGVLGVKPGTRRTYPPEDAFNASTDVYRIRLYIQNPAVQTATPLFGYVEEASITINNNVTPDKAIAVLGGFDVSLGNFEVDGELTAYFRTVDAIQAIRANNDVGFNLICCRDNMGFVYDIPLLALSGGQLTIELNEKIKIPLDGAGAENANGYTASMTFFPYLPNIAMVQ